MVVLREGDYVWVDSSIGVPIGAQVKVTGAGHRLLIDDEGKEHKITKKNEGSIRPMNPTSVSGVDDMIQLGDLNEAGLLHNLLIRHREGLIYTYTGSILVAVNPYQLLPIYTAEQVRLYHNRRLGELPPHIFAIADSCYFNMRRNLRDQCCIISGESGAGKTENTKLMLQFLAAVSGQHSWIEQQILEANPILEAFGNAKTIRNDNSSRFGKYTDIYFNKNWVIEGARVEQYLLEKSRVCRQTAEERNYHIFYCMLLGMPAEQKKTLSLRGAEEYNYLTMGNCTTCDGRDDVKEYARIRSAMKILTFTEKESWEIFKLLAAILHLGNVNFEGTILNNMEGCDIMNSDHFKMAAKLLEVDIHALETSLTYRSILTNRESVTKPLTSEQAMDGRDAFVKAIYGRMFVWIAEKINSAINKSPSNGPTYVRKSIGLLDIFGFENFNKNSFEQLCINFANEQLQQFFVQHVFKLEQDEYNCENIVWKHIVFNDNQRTLDLMAIKPLNILALIDEESTFPKGTDITMLNKMNQVHGKSKMYLPPRNYHDKQFGIQHFAGVVYYDSEGFLEKNKDSVSTDIMKLVENSSSKLLKQIFRSDITSNAVMSSARNGRVILTPKSTLRQMSETRKQMPTLSGQFRQSLDSLMKALSDCEPYFVRCFKPNEYKKPLLFDRELCMRQLRYSGMMETIRIRKSGYPIRHTFQQFLNRYRVLLKTTLCDPKKERADKCCDCICKAVIQGAGDWKIGMTKIFLKDFHDSLLELARDKEIHRKAAIIQRVMRGYKHRKNFVSQRKAALLIQKTWRGYKGRQQHRMVQLGYRRLQAKIRARRMRSHYMQKQEAAVLLQAQVRGYLNRKEWDRKKKAVRVLQAHTRGALARKTYKGIKDAAFLSAQEKRAQEEHAQELQRRLEEVLQKQETSTASREEISDQEMVENIFGFLPTTVGGQEGQAPVGFEDLEGKKVVLEEVDTEDIPIVEEAPEKEEEEIDDEHSFAKFASMHFQNSATHTHINQRLRRTLLFHDDEGDALACLTVWWMILRFMGDIPEPKQQDQDENQSIQQNLGQRKDRRLSNLVGLEQKLLKRHKKGSKGSGPSRRKPSMIPEEPAAEAPNVSATPPPKEEGYVMIGEGPTLDRPMTSLEKIHVIVGYAIVRPDTRDEIYCQICKQLVKNTNRNSCVRGWILLSICLGIFPPTDRFIKYLQNFIHAGPAEHSAHCAERLHRVMANGVRSEPTCWVELQATKTKKPIVVSVTLIDGNNISVRLDSASTSREVCKFIARKINLQDTFGFSLYIALYEKVWSLGSGGDHVMDAISQCEQEVKRKGGEEQHAPWRLYYRKEIFTPWHNCLQDALSTDLVYKQIIRGLKCGEYQSDKEDDFVQLAAKHFYVQFGADTRDENAKKVVEECIIINLVETKSEAKLVQLVKAAHIQNPYINSKTDPGLVKKEVVDYARHRWPMLFAKSFKVVKISGPVLPQNTFVVTISWTGIFFLDEKERSLLELSYPEVTGINLESDERSSGQLVYLSTLKGDFTLSAVSAVDMVELVHQFLEGLKERSRYCVALHDVNRQDDPTFLSCKKGDVLLIIKDNEPSSDRSWMKCQNERTGQIGAVSTDAVLVLATLEKPTNEVLSLLNLSPEQRVSIVQNAKKEEGASDRVAPISLKEFSFEYFRQPSKDRQALSRERLWAISREPLKQPLLNSLVGNSELSHLACMSFTAILKYMGDYPVKHVRGPLELTDQIFGPATQHEELRDEVYCQIMKQMTSNGNMLSLENGWQLMWLCCGLFRPSQVLLRHTQRFLESRPREPLASDCLQRLQGIMRIEPRKRPPHQVEVDAIQQNSTQIFHKVHFPNDTEELFEVTTTTRIRELCRSIANKLMLSSPDGYSLFVKTPEKVQSLKDTDYFFDSLRQITELSKKARAKESKKVKEGIPTSMPYLVFFMRKLWFNVSPGRDWKADLIFHFPQELPKYLRGYHKCTKEDMFNLGGLLFRTKVDTDRSEFIMIPRMLKDLVPSDQLNAASPEEWKKNIIASYNKQAGMTVDEAKVAFLKVIAKWPTFGCTFFETRQTSQSSLPGVIRLAISKHGVAIIDPKTKDGLAKYTFNEITNWSSGNTYFHMTIGNLVKGGTLLCETPLGYKIDDLLASYIDMYLNERKAVRPKNQLFRS
ncbi:unconventional myosin-VIIb-like [Anguilla anguilla]|uniref:unconventional myosin-VIIb-like n=1 Tax=Anguilla anguilla TaxID=7936 RepID=UPI0015B2A0A3|nr:unconventional myosin-VIIb-like [Anguilla anguilla]XP_035276927.1 unconventional myosin-VIIb-like [Anguilla anguilla]